jgi:hypothetical protein
MKNQTSFQLLEAINFNSMATIKGGATMDEVNNALDKGLISQDQFQQIVEGVGSGSLDLKTLTGEWWGGGALKG